MPRAEPSRARQSYSQWRICCRDSLILRVYGLLKGFAHCISSSLGQRLSNLITLRHWNYCNMLYCRQHSQCVCLSLCVCVSDFIGPMRVCWLAWRACECVCVWQQQPNGAFHALIFEGIFGQYLQYILCYICKYLIIIANTIMLRFYLEINLAWQCASCCTVGQRIETAESK